MALIIAILPEEVKGVGICSRVYTQNDSYIDYNTPTLMLEKLYKQKGKSKKEMDKKFTKLTQIKRNIPYTIDSNQVFFAFKFRQTSYDKQSRGFVNVTFVREIKDNYIILKTGEMIATLNKQETLIQNKNNAMIMLLREILKIQQEENNTIRFLNGNIIS